MYPSNCCLYLLILTISVASSASAKHNIPEAFDYQAFRIKHGKSYEPLEEISRAKLFYARTLKIYTANVLYVQHRINHYLGQNEYTDLSPEEIRNLFKGNNDLPPVKEAKDSPDTPADYFVTKAVKEEDPSDINDGMTRSSLADLSSSVDDEQHSGSNFFESSETSIDFDPSKLISELSRQPTLAEGMSKIINIRGSAANQSPRRDSDEKKPNIPFKPIVEPTNPNFDPETVETRGFTDTRDKYNQFYSNIMMDDFLGYLEPYPEPAIADDEIPDDDRGILTKFVDSLRSIRDLFSIADDDEIFSGSQEKTKLNEESKNSHQNSNELDQDSNESGIVYKIDWRKTGCISRLKDQGKCNSCYAFATLDLLEYFYCRQMGEATEFSAQYLIDCGTSSGLNGCQGGRLQKVKEFIISHGLQVSALYPYVAQSQTCRYHKSELDNAYLVKPEIKKWGMFSTIKEWYKWIHLSPIIVSINMPLDFLEYGGGIHEGLNCMENTGHALLLVGAGTENGKKFWLLKNTFSEDWGEGGYFRLSRSAPIKCFGSIVVTRVAFKETSNQAKILARVSRNKILQ